MKISRHYILQELVPPEVFQKFGNNSIWFIDLPTLALLDFFCDHFGAHATVNTWHLNGERRYSGYRHHACTVGAEDSQHRFARAMDIQFQEFTPQEVHQEVHKQERAFMNAGLTTLEDLQDTTGKGGPGWTHIDTRATLLSNILIVRS